MQIHTTRVKAYSFCLALVLLTTFGLTSPHQLEAKNGSDSTPQKQELKKNKIKPNHKKQDNKADAAQKAEEDKKAEEAKKAEQKPSVPVTPDKKKYASPNGNQVMTDGRTINFRSAGVIFMHGYRYSYYSSRVLYHYRTPEWYACDDHIYRTADGYVVVASGTHAMGAIVPTPFGPGKVLDRCHIAGTIDIYVNF